MYERDMPRMRKHALATQDNLVSTIAFVLCTIQQPLQSVKNQMADIKIHGANSKYLFGSKRIGYQYALDHAAVLHAAVTKAVEVNDIIGCIDVLSNVPGLGIVKASFVAQIIGLQVACLDTHNLRRLGLGEATFKLAKSVKPATKRCKIATYVKACRDGAPHGHKRNSSAYWWNSWCAFVAGTKFNKSLPTADRVSAYHVECLA